MTEASVEPLQKKHAEQLTVMLCDDTELRADLTVDMTVDFLNIS